MPKNKNIIVFGGRQFGGNTRALFKFWQHQYVINKTTIRPIWITPRKEILNKKYDDVLSAHSLKGMLLAANASAVCFTHSLGDFSPVQFPSKRVKLFNLWHGMPIKKISTQDPRFHQRSYAKSNLREMKRFTSMFVTSKKMQEIFALTFRLSKDKVQITGQPRTDEIFKSTVTIDETFNPKLPSHSKKILHCPTWRDGEAVKLFPFENFDVEKLQTTLEKLDAIMFVRTHPNDPGKLEKRDRRLVPLQGDVLADITGALPLFDVLITDYSSVYFDFLLLNRPTIFLPYDVEKYEQMPGFYIPFKEIAAGDIPETFNQFLDALTDGIELPSKTEGQRREIQKLVYDIVDANASTRVFDYISNLI